MADTNYEELFDSDVIDVDGTKIGSIGQVYLDDQTGQPSWVTVKTGLFGLKETFVPLEQAVIGNGTIKVPFSTTKVKDAPRVDPDKHLDADEEAQLYEYYGLATAATPKPNAPQTPQAPAEAAPAAGTAASETAASEPSGHAPVGDAPAASGPTGEAPSEPKASDQSSGETETDAATGTGTETEPKQQ